MRSRFLRHLALAAGAIALTAALSSTASAQSIILAGSSNSYVKQALDNLGVTYTEELSMWATPDAADVLIMADDGGTDTPVDYSTHLANGRHVLMIGGSNWGPYYSWVDGYLTRDASTGWHTSGDCMSDWTTTGANPVTALLPATYEFADQDTSYHMLHFAASQPAGTVLLGQTCHAAPDNYVAAVRTYPSGGTFTYMALDLGQYQAGTTSADFVEPFLHAYLAARACGNGSLDSGEQCDDGNNAGGDCCSSTCQYESNGSPCDDSDACTGPDTCDGAGTCLTPAVDCSDDNPCSQDTCNPVTGCANTFGPAAGCRTAGKSLLIVKNSSDNGKDQVIWKWLNGAATDVADFATPTGGTDYALCLYSGANSATIRLPAGSSWQAAGSSGFSFTSAGTPDGGQKAKLKAGAAGKAKAQVKGKGPNLPDTVAPALLFPVTAQLVNDTNSVCYESVFNAATKNDSNQFKAKTP